MIQARIKCAARHPSGRKCGQVVQSDGEAVVQHSVFRDTSGLTLLLCRTCVNRHDVVDPLNAQGFALVDYFTKKNRQCNYQIISQNHSDIPCLCKSVSITSRRKSFCSDLRHMKQTILFFGQSQRLAERHFNLKCLLSSETLGFVTKSCEFFHR